MTTTRKIFFFTLKIAIKVLNWLGISLAVVLGVLLYVIIFEVPISYFNHYIEKDVFHNLVTIKKVYIKWDYNIKKPVIMIGGINYVNQQNKVAFTFDHLGVSFDLKEMLFHYKFYPIYINLEGFYLSGVRKADNTYSFNVKQDKNDVINDLLNNINNNDDDDKVENNSNTANTALVTNGNNKSDNIDVNQLLQKGFYQVFIDYKQKYKSLNLLKEIDIDDSQVDFSDELKSKQFNIEFKRIHLTYDGEQKKLLAATNIRVTNKLTNNVIDIDGSITSDANKNLFFNYSLNNLSPQLLLSYAEYSLAQNTQTAGLNTNANITGWYKFGEGLKSINTSLHLSSGEIFTKGIVGNKVLIQSLDSQINYNVSKNTIDIPSFALELPKNSQIALLALQSNIYLKGIKLTANLNLGENKFNFNNIVINNDNITLAGNINFANSGMAFNFSSDTNININDLPKLWPTKLAIPSRDWVIKHVYNGLLSGINIKGDIKFANNNYTVNSLDGRATIGNAVVRYVDDMPVVTSDTVDLTFNTKGVDINYTNGKTGNMVTKKGEVKILTRGSNNTKDLDSVLTVNSEVEGNIYDALVFINSKPLYLLQKSNLDAKKFSGDLAGNVKLEYSFTKHKIQNIDIELVSHYFGLQGAFKNKDITNGNINLKIDDDHLAAYGNASYFDIPISVFTDVSWQDNVPYAVKIDAESKNIALVKVKQLGLLPDFLNNSLFGNADLSMEIQHLKKNNKDNIQANLDLTNTEIKQFPVLDYAKAEGDPLKAMVNLTVEDNKLITINQLELSSAALSAQLKLNFNDDNSTNVLINRLNINNKADLKGYLYLSDSEFNINLNGNFLDVGWVINALKGQSKLDNKDSKENTANTSASNKPIPKGNNTTATTKDDKTSALKKNYTVKLNIKKVVNKDVTIKNLYLNLDLYDKILNTLVASGDLKDNKDITIVLDKTHNQIALNIGNVGDVLEFLNVTNKIKNGSIAGKFNFSQDKNYNVNTDGVLTLNNFDIGALSFFSGKISFVGYNYDLDILNLVLKGNVIGGTLSGKYLGDQNYIELSGYIVPIWSANYLLLQVPILSDILQSNFTQGLLSGTLSGSDKKGGKTVDKNKGVINLPFKAYGDVANIKYEFGKGIPARSTSLDNSNDDSDVLLNNIIPDDKAIGDPR